MGMGGRGCRWGAAGARFDCWFFDTDNSEGFTGSDPAAVDITGTAARSPLAAPFMSFAEGGYRYAVFPESFTGGDITRVRKLPVGNDETDSAVVKTTKRVRTAPYAESWLRDPTDGAADDSVLQVLICSEDATNEHQDCSWAASNHSAFRTAMRARYP
ncbi:hypothetical protein [Candidatus Poriferisodalis sp.]|uniref:hypothetical protein n=1 Tax=Candidatus Poriferisodalis sp. TaxID=3101277 RepID=UPI003B028D78